MPNDVTRQKISEEIDAKLQKVRELLAECEMLADRGGVEFNFSIGYGMGGTYYPPKSPNPDANPDEDGYDDDNAGWHSSSSKC